MADFISLLLFEEIMEGISLVTSDITKRNGEFALNWKQMVYLFSLRGKT
jgi:hypothetical protein